MLPGEYRSFFKQVNGNEGEKCRYNARMDVYGCGCAHNCDYCYARSLLSFRGLWKPESPHVADIEKIKKKIKKLPMDMIIRLRGTTDCFQSFETQHRLAYDTICELNAIPEITVCQDVSEHYQYWRDKVNPNKNDCCNLRFGESVVGS